LYSMIEEIVATWSRDDLGKALDGVRVPNAPIQTIDQVLAHEQTRSLGILQKSPDGKFTHVSSPLSIDGARLPFRRSPPELGEHTEEVLGTKAGKAQKAQA
jgi:crotonobetainyl-CoA:carnitine CoA-transferase CaiB-like acyl-CoA transferase